MRLLSVVSNIKDANSCPLEICLTHVRIGSVASEHPLFIKKAKFSRFVLKYVLYLNLFHVQIFVMLISYVYS